MSGDPGGGAWLAATAVAAALHLAVFGGVSLLPARSDSRPAETSISVLALPAAAVASPRPELARAAPKLVAVASVPAMSGHAQPAPEAGIMRVAPEAAATVALPAAPPVTRPTPEVEVARPSAEAAVPAAQPAMPAAATAASAAEVARPAPADRPVTPGATMSESGEAARPDEMRPAPAMRPEAAEPGTVVPARPTGVAETPAALPAAVAPAPVARTASAPTPAAPAVVPDAGTAVAGREAARPGTVVPTQPVTVIEAPVAPQAPGATVPARAEWLAAAPAPAARTASAPTPAAPAVAPGAGVAAVARPEVAPRATAAPSGERPGAPAAAVVAGASPGPATVSSPAVAAAPAPTTPERVTAPVAGQETAMLTPARTAPPAVPGIADTYRGVLDFLRRYDGGGCFVALPSLRGGLLGLDGFTGDESRLAAFAEEFSSTTGVAADARLDPVSAAQCRALTFARNLPAYPAFSLRFEIPHRQLRSGERLEGTVRNVDGRTLHLLLVDDEGKVQSADGFARRAGADATFAAHMTLTGGPVETVQLVVALATDAPLETVARLSGEEAGTFFAELAEEIAARHLSPDLAIASFSVR